jgi:pimeloyl-ACP methyl ester carboxylesterase
MASQSVAVVMVHGSASTPSAWRSVVKSLDARAPSATVLTPAIPGCEEEMPGDVPDLSFDELVAGVDRQLDLADRPVVLVGFSFGALIALRLASIATWNLKAMVLVEPMVVPMLAAMGYREEHEQLGRVFDDFVDGVDAGRPDASEGIIDAWLGTGSYASAPPKLKELFWRWAPMNASQVRATLARPFDPSDFSGIPDVPTVATYGSAGPAIWRCFADRAARVVPSGETYEIRGGTHAALVTHADEVASLIAAQL